MAGAPNTAMRARLGNASGVGRRVVENVTVVQSGATRRQRASDKIRNRCTIHHLETIGVDAIARALVRANDISFVALRHKMHGPRFDRTVLQRQPKVDVAVDPIRSMVGGILMPGRRLRAQRRLRHRSTAEELDLVAEELLRHQSGVGHEARFEQCRREVKNLMDLREGNGAVGRAVGGGFGVEPLRFTRSLEKKPVTDGPEDFDLLGRGHFLHDAKSRLEKV